MAPKAEGVTAETAAAPPSGATAGTGIEGSADEEVAGVEAIDVVTTTVVERVGGGAVGMVEAIDDAVVGVLVAAAMKGFKADTPSVGKGRGLPATSQIPAV